MSEIEARCAPFADDLSALLDGELVAARVTELEAHVHGCADCARRLAALRAVDAALVDLANAGADGESERLDRVRARAWAGVHDEGLQRLRAPRRSRRWLLPAAAGTLAAAAAAFFVAIQPAPPPAPLAESAPEKVEIAAPAAPAQEEIVVARESTARPEPPLGASAVADDEAAALEASDAELELAAALEDLEAASGGDLELVEQLDLVESPDALDAPERRERRDGFRARRAADLSPEERRRLSRRVARLREMQPEERARLDRNVERWRAMSPDERERMRERWERFRALPPEEQERLLRERDRTP